MSSAVEPDVRARGVWFARWVYGLAGLIGLVMLAPLYGAEAQYGLDHPPAITHAEFFYGFVGLGLAWQVAFLIIAADPVRYRPLMWATFIEKFSFAGVALPMALAGRAPAVIGGGASFDLLLGVLFVVAYRATRRRR